MRFDTPVYFQRITPGEYDAETGDYGPDDVAEIKVYASVTNSGAETLNLVYGKLKQDSLTVRLQNHYTAPFDRLRIGEDESAKYYHVDMARALRNKHIFVISEVQHGKNQS